MPITEETAGTLRPELTQIVNEYDVTLAEQMFIGLDVAPIFESEVDAGTYPIYKRENLLQAPETSRRENGGYNRVDTELDGSTFQCEDHGLEHPIGDSEAKKYGRYMDLESAAAVRMWYQLRLAHERRVAALVNTNCTTGAAAATNWATIANATPISDIATRGLALEQRCGVPVEGQTLVCTNTTFTYLKNNASILDRIKYTAREVGDQRLAVQRRLIADALGVRDVLVGKGGYNTKNKGVAPSLSSIWSDTYGWLTVLAPAASPNDLKIPCVARTILWTADSPSVPVIETYRDESVRGNVVRVRMNVDEVIPASDADIFAERITIGG